MYLKLLVDGVTLHDGDAESAPRSRQADAVNLRSGGDRCSALVAARQTVIAFLLAVNEMTDSRCARSQDEQRPWEDQSGHMGWQDVCTYLKRSRRQRYRLLPIRCVELRGRYM